MGDSEAALVCIDSHITDVSYTLGTLSSGTDIFWRIDANNALGTTTGDVWKFTNEIIASPEFIGYWLFNETEGNIVYDSSIHTNHGSAQNTASLGRIDGQFG